MTLRLIKMLGGRVHEATAPPVVTTGLILGSDDPSSIVNRRQRSARAMPSHLL